MILQIMVSALLVGVCCALGAAMAEWTISLRRALPVRWIWVAAMLTSVTMPLARASFTAQLSGQRTEVAPVSSSAPRMSGSPDNRADRSAPETNARPQDVTRPAGIRAAGTRNAMTLALTIPEISRRASMLIAAAWFGTSLCLCIALFWSFRRLSRERENWKRVTLRDTQVLVSDGFGPALIGLFRPDIVLPPWVLTLDAAAAKTILAHEIEHRRAGDSRLIVGALMLCIAMPWNPLLWWMTARLVRAVEFDCDARVVSQGINTATYADLLLGAWQHDMANRRIALSAAFAERRSRLGQRVTHLLRPEPRGKIMKTLSGVTIAFCWSRWPLQRRRLRLRRLLRRQHQSRCSQWGRCIFSWKTASLAST